MLCLTVKSFLSLVNVNTVRNTNKFSVLFNQYLNKLNCTHLLHASNQLSKNCKFQVKNINQSSADFS